MFNNYKLAKDKSNKLFDHFKKHWWKYAIGGGALLAGLKFWQMHSTIKALKEKNQLLQLLTLNHLANKQQENKGILGFIKGIFK